jgi:hypothetical protein
MERDEFCFLISRLRRGLLLHGLCGRGSLTYQSTWRGDRISMGRFQRLLLVKRFRSGSRSVPGAGDAAWTVNAVIRLWVTSPHLRLSLICYLRLCCPSPKWLLNGEGRVLFSDISSPRSRARPGASGIGVGWLHGLYKQALHRGKTTSGWLHRTQR